MYKELAAELRLFGTVCKHSDKPDLADLVGRAANAIEGLQKKYDGAVSDNKSLCRQISELAKERNEAYSKGLLEGGIAQRAEDEKWLPKWIPVTEHLPKCEQEVLICTEKKLVGKDAYIDSIVTPAIYEDGTMTENDSIWQWEDIDWAGWDEDEDCGIIPEGWWENRHFNPDGVYNNPVDRKVVAWMPLPEKYEPQKVEGAYKDV